MVRYRNLFILSLALLCAGLAVEAALVAMGLPHSLTHRNGPGQILLFAIVVPSMLWFSWAIAGVNPFAFLLGYILDWRRSLAGFAVMFVFAMLAMALVYLVLGALGVVVLKQQAVDALFTPKVATKVLSGLAVVVVLATVEELIFRTFVLRYLRRSPDRRTTITAVLASALIFSLAHVIALQSAINEPDYVSLLTGLFLLGVLFGATYVATGSVACSIGLHAGVLGFKVLLRRADLLDYRPGVWWIGGAADLRSGPGIWLILVLATVAIIAMRRILWARFWVETAFAADRAADTVAFRLQGAAGRTA